MKKQSRRGRFLLLSVILILLGNEAFIFLLNSTYQPDQLAVQYFRLVLTLPVLFFFTGATCGRFG